MLLQCHFESWALHHSVSVAVILPTDYANPGERTHQPKGKFPVLYLLHGGGQDYTAWLRFTSVERYATEHRIAVVMPSCPNSCYRANDITVPGMPWEPKQTRDYETFIHQELPDWLTANFPISTAREDSYIAGLSMGGYGAAYHGFTYPECYAAAGLFSAYVFDRGVFALDRASMTREQLEEHIMPDLLEPVKAAVEKGAQLPKVMILSGSRDVWEIGDAYGQILREAGAEVTIDNAAYDCGHEWPVWDLGVRLFLEWIPRTDIYAK